MTAQNRTFRNETPLTVLSVAYPFTPVSLDAAGGAEQILALLDRGLVAASHNSIVIAVEGSRVEGTLIGVPSQGGALEAPARHSMYPRWRAAIAEALRSYRVNVVHLHGVDFYEYLPAAGSPVLVTLHLPPSFYPGEIFRLARPQTWFNCVSESQHFACPESPLLVGDIEN